MTVKVTKPALNLREELSSLKKPSGVAGEAMLRAETPQEQFNLIGAGRKNLIINGAMQVWQRGTSGTPGSLTFPCADMYWFYMPSTTSGTLEQSTDVPAGEGFIYSLKQNRDASGSMGISIELPATGKTMLKANTDYTLSFWAKGAGTGFNPYIRYRNSRGSGTNEVPLHGYTGGQTRIEFTASWERYSLTVNTGSVVPYATNTILAFEFGNFNNGAYVTGFQFEEGSVPTPFEFRSYGEELALCQRYYIRYDGAVNYLNTVGAYWSGDHYCTIQFPVVMKSAPTLYKSGTNALKAFSNGTSSASTNITGGTGPMGCELIVVNGRPDSAVFIRFNTANDYIAFEAGI